MIHEASLILGSHFEHKEKGVVQWSSEMAKEFYAGNINLEDLYAVEMTEWMAKENSDEVIVVNGELYYKNKLGACLIRKSGKDKGWFAVLVIDNKIVFSRYFYYVHQMQSINNILSILSCTQPFNLMDGYEIESSLKK